MPELLSFLEVHELERHELVETLLAFNGRAVFQFSRQGLEQFSTDRLRTILLAMQEDCLNRT